MHHILLEELEARNSYLQALIGEKKKALKKVPSGMLRCSRDGNKYHYYHRTNAKDTNGTYIRRKDRGLAKALAQRDYDRQILTQAEKELKHIQGLLKHYEQPDLKERFLMLTDPRKELVMPIELPDDLYAQEWQAQEYVGKLIDANAPEYYTDRGEKVRSKTEIFIANTLNKHQVPYRYEAPLYLNGYGTIHPDFTVLNVKERKEYYWEHMGMMDNPDYCERALERINMYEQNGFYPGDGLILTHETGSSPVRTKQIEEIIRRFLL